MLETFQSDFSFPIACPLLVDHDLNTRKNKAHSVNLRWQAFYFLPARVRERPGANRLPKPESVLTSNIQASEKFGHFERILATVL